MGLATQHIGKLTHGLRFWLSKSPNREMIHEVRVYLKKLRALWLIHPTVNIISFRHSFPALYNLFKKAGSYRDLQTALLCLETLPGWDKKNHIGQVTEKKITAAKVNLKQRIDKSSFKYKIAKELNEYHSYYIDAPGFLLRSTQKHYRTQTARLMLATDGKSDEELHDLRKRLKNSLYQCEAFPAKINQSPPVPSNDVLKLLQNELGTWHDWWFTTQYLQKLNKETEEPQLKSLLEQAEKKTALLKRQVMQNLRKQTPPMGSSAITPLGDKQIIHLSQAKQKTARLQKKVPN
jgi:CHAD domain-containing protein